MPSLKCGLWDNLYDKRIKLLTNKLQGKNKAGKRNYMNKGKISQLQD